ncbi:BREX-1 system adenine-specific DNA-methyltransferase PglX [Actimicrobium sp. CCI2.3]|uniref:BREX-1 system adenine-specific DNA-methyltransferase PglX n=1 Tax=Actimicrobium sp. CCI2.3 TaxID=3048616 RepID=UPI002AB3513D|nr:BREX-1 system adenine-specific DNA-methyltransferase PglX [Actimicrobium sp. CCI2.3]MDY7573080.1 BREX-1 system adenine-specific DNA-methyltransferase PglX [Actimicrobium sp. CCI2.3]MEB0020877.1 BREX-1 system adenine-specific DNA-methyltransferase PglX [Actimicrobium sp. CCI2.3]
MNKANLKSYAPQARKDFIAAVTARANLLGLSDKDGTLQVAAAQTQGDVTLIAGQAWSAKVDAQRNQLITRIRRDGFAHTMEAVAYTWFNRFAALRYMELHDYLGHGHRALSSTAGGLPDILAYAAELAQAGSLPGLRTPLVLEMKLAGNRDGELYRALLVAQCNALSNAMPFLFERIDDDSELLLPDNLLRSDSVIAKLVEAIPEEDWEEVEIIGWLYQFYISEKKDQVIGKVVKSEDIPAATQLFTPNWIVQYLVQNSVGRLWLMANPQSTLAQEWPYYITPAEQTPEVQAQLDALIQTRVREDGDTLNPEAITVLDPACGSGHILVVAYDVLKAIYLERGYQPRAIPRLILEKNLYGLDIDDRAAQMAGFALLMKARADDRRLFTAMDDAGNLQPPKLNVLSLQESKGLNVDELATHLAPFKVQRATITALVETFEHAKTFGSLIQIPYALKTYLPVMPQVLALVKQGGDMYATAAADDLLPLVQQARVLAMQFDAVVANPPYMGGKGMNIEIRDFAQTNFPDSKSDLFSVFIERCQLFGKASSNNGFVTPYVWMFISSYENIRRQLVENSTIQTLIQLEYNAFEPACVPVCAFVTGRSHVNEYTGSYIKLSDFKGHENQAPRTLEAINNRNCGWFYISKPDDFKKIPGSPIAYWASKKIVNIFETEPTLESVCYAGFGIKTGNNVEFMREWSEVSIENVALPFGSDVDRTKKWYPCASGGSFRKWYGNQNLIVNYGNNGADIEAYAKTNGNSFGFNARKYYFKKSITWPKLTSSANSFRETPSGHIFDGVGLSAFFRTNEHHLIALAALNTNLYRKIISLVAPTISFTSGDFLKLPFPSKVVLDSELISGLTKVSKEDWDSYEGSWNFHSLPLINSSNSIESLEKSWLNWYTSKKATINKAIELEESINQLFINTYGLQDELSSEVPEDQITLARADREKDCQRLISYAIGCMMGRYSLDEPGLIYAHADNFGYDPGRYVTFPADADGIVPITDELWFADDACSRIREFLRVVWGLDTLEENMAWLAESLGTKASETSDETIRRYIADKFFKDHLQTYKKRPIYWLFSSGKQGAFQALVYLHRYHEGTLARLRAEYVVPLTGKIQSRIEMLQKDAAGTSSTAARNKLAKEVEKLKKKHVELLAYDEQLRHYADMRITLDLDDGVKVNYGKFGDLLSEVKAVTGGAGDE